MKRWLWGSGLCLLGVLVLWALFEAVMHPRPLPPLPNPNGYDDFLAAGNSLVGTGANPDNLDREALQALIATNKSGLQLLRLGLTRLCSVPTARAASNFGPVSGDLAALKSCARLFQA